MGACYTLPTEYEHKCCVCLDSIDQKLHNRHRLRNLKTPCCQQSLHQICWEKSINRFGRCPLCREDIVPEEFMKTIRFGICYEMRGGSDLDNALEMTFLFAKCPIRDPQIKRDHFLGDTVCFTDDWYWKPPNE